MTQDNGCTRIHFTTWYREGSVNVYVYQYVHPDHDSEEELGCSSTNFMEIQYFQCWTVPFTMCTSQAYDVVTIRFHIRSSFRMQLRTSLASDSMRISVQKFIACKTNVHLCMHLWNIWQRALHDNVRFIWRKAKRFQLKWWEPNLQGYYWKCLRLFLLSFPWSYLPKCVGAQHLKPWTWTLSSHLLLLFPAVDPQLLSKSKLHNISKIRYRQMLTTQELIQPIVRDQQNWQNKALFTMKLPQILPPRIHYPNNLPHRLHRHYPL